MGHKIEPSVPFDKMMQDIEDCVGPPESETPEEAAKRHEIMAKDAELRAKRKAKDCGCD